MSEVFTRAVTAAGDWAYLDTLGRVGGLSFDWDYPGGPTSAEFDLDVPPDAHIPALSIGATITLHRGAGIVWQGKAASVDRGTPWKVQVDGLAGLATREPVAATGTLDTIVDSAITAGLPWTRPATLGGASWGGGEGGTEVGQTKLDEVLSTALLTAGKVWAVNVNGAVRTETQPSTPTMIVRAQSVPPLTLNEYATHVTARYRTSDSYGANLRYATVTVKNQAAADKFGRVNRSIDLSGMGVITSTTATSYATNYLNAVSPRMTVAGDFQITPGQATTEAGAPLDLAYIRPGAVARIQLVALIRDALIVPTTSVDMLIGRTSFDVDSDVLTLSPAGRAADPLQIMFGGRAVRSED